MKKFIVVIATLLVFASIASAEVIGTLGLNDSNVQARNSVLAHVFDAGLDDGRISMKFYDSLMLMQLALNKGEIGALAAPDFVGEYMLRTNPSFKLRGFILLKQPIAFAFGFIEEKSELRDSFSKAVEEMEEEGKIGLLARDYITGPSAQNPPEVKFENFDGAETITTAVTGDQPPLDYVGADGEPAGFNTAILAEIGRRLHINIKTITVETGARASALKSGRADVVFWIEKFEGYDVQPDVPAGIIISTPYYGWNKSVLIGRK